VETVDHVSVEEKTVSIAINVCPIVQLTREDNTTIRLKWNEKAGVIVYMFHQPRKNEPGFWISAGNQNGRSEPLLLGSCDITVRVGNTTVVAEPKVQHR